MARASIRDLVEQLYGAAPAPSILEGIAALMDRYRPMLVAPSRGPLDEKDAVLITYADQVSEPGRAPLRSLGELCATHLRGLITGVHLLPFYPSSSDDGFSVMDYRRVDPGIGDFADLAPLRRDFRLMFDAVLNHASARGEWFRRFLEGDPGYRDYFIAVEGDPDLSRVVRPRALPLLTRFATSGGERRLWTTFSDDQVDLNYRSPALLLEVLDILLFYVSQGAELLRLDAIAYLWKEPGTTCIHHPSTHRVVQLVRAVLAEVAPWVLIITETNVPHAENVSYFGDGENEAQLVYNFALPPLLLDALLRGRADRLSEWARGLVLPSPRTTFFNFLASHDGVGLNPARGLIEPGAIEALVESARARGGLVSMKHEADGSSSPYELNINYLDALCEPGSGAPSDEDLGRFLAAHAVMLSLVGLPAIYFHSLFGSRGWPEGVRLTGRNRTINRQKLARADLERELADPGSLRRRVLTALARLLRDRGSSPAFHPHGRQRVLEAGDRIFAVEREAPDGAERVLCLQNLSSRPARVQGEAAAGPELELTPYQTCWRRVS